eukprot:CAMPEP_0176255454 /NCGR_PEP_ID=MMETSP0121_2-20121125/37049_1 /TAXON_ID=160619 /ORGANISM="Kryptoperidinium foliaceum, Strain CCMP 1326" /LENGTH=262 /DNA_ID=CAMNT_0017595281 /DNA_START=35 /DNA_END=820 /DNA_ORIENTATION=+
MKPRVSNSQAFFSEFVGTFFLVFTFGLNALQHTALGPVSVGSIYAALVFATFGGEDLPSRAAHFNPAVTVGVLLGRRSSLGLGSALLLLLGQCVGGLVAGLTYFTVLSATFSLRPGEGHSANSAFIVEVVFSAVLALVFLGVTSQRQPHPYHGLAVGSVVTAAGFAIGGLSGCALNPALALGVLGSHWAATGKARNSSTFTSSRRSSAASWRPSCIAASSPAATRGGPSRVEGDGSARGATAVLISPAAPVAAAHAAAAALR